MPATLLTTLNAPRNLRGWLQTLLISAVLIGGSLPSQHAQGFALPEEIDTPFEEQEQGKEQQQEKEASLAAASRARVSKEVAARWHRDDFRSQAARKVRPRNRSGHRLANGLMAPLLR